MKVRWTPQARQDRIDIWEYLAARDAAAAVRMDQRFSDAVAPLVDFPLSGREGLPSGTRQLIPHPSYRLVYEIFGETVWILALVHTSREWPPIRDHPSS